MYNLFKECLLHYPRTPGVDFSHALREFGRQFAATQVYIKESCLNAAVSSEGGDLVDIPVRSCQIRQA